MLLPITLYRERESDACSVSHEVLVERMDAALEAMEWYMDWARQRKRLGMDTKYHVERARHYCRKFRGLAHWFHALQGCDHINIMFCTNNHEV